MRTSTLSVISQIFLAPFTPSYLPASSPSTTPNSNTNTGVCPCNINTTSVHISNDWHVLGPFQIGTREAEWGSDPLKLYSGGFQKLSYEDDPNALFKSSLTRNGTVGWSLAQFRSSASGSFADTVPEEMVGEEGIVTIGWFNSSISSAENPGKGAGVINGDVSDSMNNVDWSFLRQIYGWSASSQYQAWARGTITICSPPSSESSSSTSQEKPIGVRIYISPALELSIDRNPPAFGGDMFSYHRTPAKVVYLTPGEPHTIDVRVARDVRALGGWEVPPLVDVRVRVEVVGGEGGGKVGKGELVVEREKAVVPDVVIVDGNSGGDGDEKQVVMAGEGWVSVPVRNEREEGWIEILGVSAEYDDIGNGNRNEHENISPKFIFKKSKKGLFRLAPGQSRPLKVRITDFPSEPTSNITNIPLIVQYRVEGEDSEIQHLSSFLIFPKPKSVDEPHILTYLHPSGIVSYAILRPPSPNATCGAATELPILLSLHGAGVDVRWDSAKDAYAKMPDLCAWLLIPQGVTLWSGDDWHIWGWADVEAAIASIPDWILSTNWLRHGVDLDKWVVTGHSNGGQGAWYALTHWSDNIIAATPLSGYLSVQAYIPYNMWHEADPKISALVLASMNSYRHELLVDNIAGTPILQGHGELDDNVPIFHSRRMRGLAHEIGWETEYIEFPDQGHWWEGVMTDGRIPDFLNHHINQKPVIPDLPQNFSIVVANPADMGPRGGVVVEQLETYDRLGKMNVERTNSSIWSITTSNIRRWRFGKGRPGLTRPKKVLLDSQSFSISDGKELFMISAHGEWRMVRTEAWKKKERSGRQLGALDAFQNTRGPFTIVLPPVSERKFYHRELAIEIANNLFQYYAADSEIVEDKKYGNGMGNVILIDTHNPKVHEQSQINFGISIQNKRVSIRDTTGKRKTFEGKGLGAIFLEPLGMDRLTLVVWGADEEGLRAAARLVPLRTGVGQPNFVVLGREAGWKGVGGALAMGMFDSDWKVASGLL